MALAQITGVVHISFPVNDLQESIRFYTEILGFTERGKIGLDGFCLMAGDTPIILTQRPEPLPFDQPLQQNGQLCHQAFYIASEDYEAAKHRLLEHGVPIDGQDWRRTGAFTGRSVYFREPSGNRPDINDPNPPSWPDNVEEIPSPRRRLFESRSGSGPAPNAG